MTRDEQNQKIAHWIKELPHGMDEGDEILWKPHDFFTDEVANATILEKIPPDWEVELYRYEERYREKVWSCGIMERGAAVALRGNHSDRKTAICLAVLQLIERMADEL